jgi:hypothetical protein
MLCYDDLLSNEKAVGSAQVISLISPTADNRCSGLAGLGNVVICSLNQPDHASAAVDVGGSS